MSPSTFFDADWDENAPASGPEPRRRVRRTSRRRKLSILVALALAGSVVAVVLPGQSASADPSANTWYRLRMCESGDRYSIDTGNGYYGAYQFDLSTWRSVGGSGYPSHASKTEQDARALILYRERGWQPWTCASILGLREDRDARSGRTSDIRITRVAPPTATAIPAFPARHWYYPGANNKHIKAFQDEMHRRGYFPVGTGEYGPNTLRMVKQLQRLNGLVPNGAIGPNTWRLAWTGRYSTSSAARAVPTFPAKHWYYPGANNKHIKTFQDEMHRRGYFPVGTGEYGPNTLRMVKRLQRLNGLVPNGAIGPNTWRLAWIGKY